VVPRAVSGVLLLYNRPVFFKDAATITDHIDAFGRHSAFPVVKLNTGGGFPSDLASVPFSAVILHYTLFASGPNPYLLDRKFLDWLRESDAYKVAFFQDEHEYCRRRFKFLDDYGVNCVYTCFSPEQFDATYRRYTKVDRLVSYMPAYVSPDMVAEAQRLFRPDAERRIDVGYRTRPTPPYFGRGGVEKMEIGELFAERAAASGLRLDISSREEDRLYGEHWYEFLADSRGQLGTESGASCVDLEDQVREEYLRRTEEGEEVTLEALERGALGHWDGRVELRTTSSRHFEAAAMRVCQIMYEGRYSGVLEADRHFLALRKDFSNLDDVLDRFKDPAVRAEITANAYSELIASGEYSYERFIAGFDETLAEAGVEPGRAPMRAIAIRGRPIKGKVVQYLQGASAWLLRAHPRAWRTVMVLLTPVWLLLGLARKLRGLEND
jgi:hypothetical protein